MYKKVGYKEPLHIKRKVVKQLSNELWQLLPWQLYGCHPKSCLGCHQGQYSWSSVPYSRFMRKIFCGCFGINWQHNSAKNGIYPLLAKMCTEPSSSRVPYSLIMWLLFPSIFYWVRDRDIRHGEDSAASELSAIHATCGSEGHPNIMGITCYEMPACAALSLALALSCSCYP